jgi:hypothetical protein
MEKTLDRPPMGVGALKGANREALKHGRGQARRANDAAALKGKFVELICSSACFRRCLWEAQDPIVALFLLLIILGVYPSRLPPYIMRHIIFYCNYLSRAYIILPHQFTQALTT